MALFSSLFCFCTPRFVLVVFVLRLEFVPRVYSSTLRGVAFCCQRLVFGTCLWLGEAINEQRSNLYRVLRLYVFCGYVGVIF